MDIFTPLYHEGVLFFLLGEYLSYVADKIKGGGGRDSARDIIQIFFPRFRFFFIFIQICLSWRVAGLLLAYKAHVRGIYSIWKFPFQMK